MMTVKKTKLKIYDKLNDESENESRGLTKADLRFAAVVEKIEARNAPCVVNGIVLDNSDLVFK